MQSLRSLLIVLLFHSFVYAIAIDEDMDKRLNILVDSKIYIDKTKQLTIDNIKGKKFEKNFHDSLRYGFSPDFNLWIKFTLENTSDKKLKRILEYSNPLTTHIEFYNGDKIFKDGIYQLNYKRKSINPVFEISLNPKERKTYYLKVSSYITTLIVKLDLWDEELFDESVQKHNMILSMFFASMLVLVIYNIFIYFYTKDKNYLFYVLFMSGLIFHQLVYTGFGNIYLLNNELSILCVEYAEIIVAFPIFMFALLVRSFLRIKQYPFFLKGLNIYLSFFPVLVGVSLFSGVSGLRNIFSLILLMLLVIICLYALLKKNRQAYFVLVGWVLFVFAGVFMFLSSAGLLDISDEFKYFAEIAFLIEGIIFSLALADKIKQLEYNKNKANMELILRAQFEKQRLENQVKQKTKELNEALEEKSLLLKELNHRVKNNMQTIVSLIRLQSDKYKDDDIKELLTVIQNRINAMGSLHELLYKQDNISYINAKVYFHMLIDELKEGFKSENVQMDYHIKSDLKAEDAVYCGLIINELVTNAFKYAFGNDKGEIKIVFEKKLGKYLLFISDDGKGYDEKEVKSSLGTLLVEGLVKRQLAGKIKKDTDNGVKVKILW